MSFNSKLSTFASKLLSINVGKIFGIDSNGDAILMDVANPIQPITAIVASNALTVGLGITSLSFRSPTLTSGTSNVRYIQSPISLVIPSGATLGTVNTILSRLILIAIDNAGTVELAVVNLMGGNNLDETGLISTTAISSGASSASTFYSTTARTNVPFRVIGYIELTQATAGTWANPPSIIQGNGGQAVSALAGFGFGQTAQNVIGSRAIGTTYYNTTGKAITVIVASNQGSTGVNLAVSINGSAAAIFAQCVIPSGAAACAGSFIVPAGASYIVSQSGGIAVVYWTEIR